MGSHVDASVFPSSSETLTEFWDSWLPQDQITDNMLGLNPAWSLNLGQTLELHAPANSGLSDHLPLGPDGVSTVNGGCRTPHGHTGDDGIGCGNDVSDSGGPNSSTGHRPTMDKSDFEASIAHLSQLSSRLSQLIGCSRSFLAEALDTFRQSKNHHDPALQVRLGIEGVFKSITTWLVHGSGNSNLCTNLGLGPTNAFDLPPLVFSASNHLLGILRHTSTFVESSATRSPCDAGVHHLVHVCVILLLNMYNAILTALQRSADALNSSPLPYAGDPTDPHDQLDAASRGHLQLVSVANLCSYFIKRQNQTLDLILARSQGPLHTPSSRENGHRQSASFDTMSALRNEVKQRLKRLQESL
jgi:hypothetical protein